MASVASTSASSKPSYKDSLKKTQGVATDKSVKSDTANTSQPDQKKTDTTKKTFAERMREKASAIDPKTIPRDENEVNFEEWKAKKTESDIKKFYETKVQPGIEEKIEKRADKGLFSVNLMEYNYKEYFYVSKTDELVMLPEYTEIKGNYMHRVYAVVNSETFKKMLKADLDTLGDIRIACWAPKKDLNVVEVYWGNTKYHNYDAEEEAEPEPKEKKEEDEPKEEKKKEEEKKEEKKKGKK